MRFSQPLHEKCPYSEFFWSIFSPNLRKYRPEKLRIWTLHAVSNVLFGFDFIKYISNIY